MGRQCIVRVSVVQRKSRQNQVVSGSDLKTGNIFSVSVAKVSELWEGRSTALKRLQEGQEIWIDAPIDSFRL
jgi:hypothetical protein